MDAWNAGSLLVIDVKVNVLCWCRFSSGKTSFSKWRIRGLQSLCPTHNSGFGAGGKRDRKQQCWAHVRTVVGRTGAEPGVFPGWGTPEPGWGIDVGSCSAQAAQGDLGVTACPLLTAELPLLLTSARPPAPAHSFPRLQPPGMLSLEKNSVFFLMQGGDNFIRPLVSMSLAPPGLFATTSVTMSCVTYTQYLYQKYRNNPLNPLCWAFWFLCVESFFVLNCVSPYYSILYENFMLWCQGPQFNLLIVCSW